MTTQFIILQNLKLGCSCYNKIWALYYSSVNVKVTMQILLQISVHIILLNVC